jgi:hypothetical protein
MAAAFGRGIQDELGAVQELGSTQKSPGKIGAIEHRLEEVGAVQMSR